MNSWKIKKWNAVREKKTRVDLDTVYSLVQAKKQYKHQYVQAALLCQGQDHLPLNLCFQKSKRPNKNKNKLSNLEWQDPQQSLDVQPYLSNQSSEKKDTMCVNSYIYRPKWTTQKNPPEIQQPISESTSLPFR